MDPYVRAFFARLGREVYAKREARGSTQAEVAERAGASENSVMNFERVRGWPNVATMLAICGVVGVSIGDDAAVTGGE